MSALGRQRAAVAAGLRSAVRERTTTAMLLVLPPVVIVTFQASLDAMAQAPGVSTDPTSAARGGALFATAFLAGLLAVFQVVGTADADRRLVRAGYRPVELLGARLATVVLSGALVAAITFASFLALTGAEPAGPVRALGVLVLAALTYGLIGVVVGALVGRELEGSLVLVFLADFDSFGALDVVPVESAVLDYLPLARPGRLLESAVADGTLPAGDLLGALAYVVGLAVLATAIVELRGDVA